MEMIKSVLIKNMKALRKAKGWNQDKLAEEAGYSTSFIADIERGKSWVSPEAIDKICKAFDVSCDKLFAIDEEKGKMFDLPMSKAIRKLMAVPDEVYDLAHKLGDPQSPIWEEIAAQLEDEIAYGKKNKGSNPSS